MLRDVLPGMGVPTKLGRCVTTRKGMIRFPEDYVAKKGRSGIYLFWSLAFPDGIKCTLGVCHGTMSQ